MEKKKIMIAIAKELVDAREIEKKNTARMPRLEGYIEGLEFSLSTVKFNDRICEDCGSEDYPYHNESCTMGETSNWEGKRVLQ